MNAPNQKILLVDDEEALLSAFRRTYRKQLNLTLACGPEAGLACLEREGPFQVVVSDYQMPVMDGIQFLVRVRDLAPDTVRVMLTGNADQRSAMSAVNEGNVFRFLTKPCDQTTFLHCMESALEQARLIGAERELLEQTVRGIVEVLTDLLSLSCPIAFRRATRIRSYVAQLAERLHSREAWLFETAALLSQVGLVALPGELLERSETTAALEPREQALFERHPGVARQLLGKIPRLEKIAEIVELQRSHHRDQVLGYLDQDVALGARLLATSIAFDELISSGSDRLHALAELKGRDGEHHPRLLSLLEGVVLPGVRSSLKTVRCSELRAGMLLDQDLMATSGAKLVPRGGEVTVGMLARLRNYDELGQLPATVVVRLVDDEHDFPSLKIA